MSETPILTRTLVLTIALPDFNVEDVTQEAATEFYDGSVEELAFEAMSLITHTARLFVATGDKGGNGLHDARAVIVAADVVERIEEHDEPQDERLTEMLREWREER
jgi:hypothetical protein